MKSINQLFLASLLMLFCASATWAQTNLTLKLTDIENVGYEYVFYSGSQYADASFVATFGGTGTKSFNIVSPGENTTKTVTGDGVFAIRPTGNYTLDKTKIIGFNGTVTGSIAVTAKQLTINTYSVQESQPTPGATITTIYQTGTGNYPVDLTINKFAVELLDNNGNRISELANPNDMGGNYTSREAAGYSNGNNRFITATLPSSLAAGTYKVRVVTKGLKQQVIGAPSASFTIAAPQVYQVSTKPTGINVTSACPGGQIVLSADVVDDGQLAIRETVNPSGGGAYWVSYYDAKTNQLALDFQTYNEEYLPPVTTRASGVYTASNRIFGPITIPNLPPGSYYCKIFVGDPASRLNPNNAGNSPTFTVNAPATVRISDGNPNIKPGEAAAIQLSFGGTGPWSFSHDQLNGSTYSKQNETQNPAFIYIYPTSDYLFDTSKLLTFSGACGNGSKSGSSQIRVAKQTISTVAVSRNDICPGRDAFTVTFRLSSNPSAIYVAQLSDQNGSFNSPRDIGSNKVSPITTEPSKMGSASPGNYKIRVIAADNSADWDGSTVPITLTRAPLPTFNDLSYCQGAPQVIQASGQNIFWYGISKDNQPYVGYDKATTPPSPTEPGFYRFQLGQTVDGCNSDLADLKVTVKSASSPPGDASREFCQNESAQPLTTNAQNPIWYDASGTQLPSAPAPPTSTATTITYKLSQDTNGCRSGQSTVTVRVKPLPAAPAFTPPDVLCQFGPSRPLTASGEGLKWYRADGSLIGTNAPTPALGSTATQTYQVSQTKEGCEGPKVKIDQPFKASPAKPGTAPISYCVNQTSVSLTASGQNLTWYQNGTKLSEAPKPPTTQNQTLTYEVTQTDNGCESERNSLIVSVLSAPGKPTVKPVGLCVGQTPASLTASVTADGPLKWYDDATTPSGQNDPKVPPVTQPGTQSYFVTQTVGNCEGPRAQLNVTVYPIPTAPTFTAPAPVCEGKPQPVGPFVANGLNKKWTFAGQAGTSDQPPTTATTTPGTFTVAVTQTVDGCTSPQTIISQTINPAPVKPTVTPLLLCRADPQTPVSATALPGHKLNWYGQSETGGTASSAAPVITTSSTLNTNYYVSQTLETTSCESLRQAVSVVVADAPPAPSVNAVQQVCLNTTPTALTAGGNGLFWTASAGGGLTSPTVNPVPPTTTAATFSYTVVQRLGTCVGPASTITFTVRPLPAVPVVKPLQIACINDPSFALSASAIVGHTLRWYDSPQRTNPQSSVTIQTGTAGTKNWFVTQTDNIGCESAPSSQTSKVLAKATARLYGDGDVYFFDSTAIRIQLGGEGPWNLTLWNDKTITNNLINPLVVWVPPTTVTRTYALKALSNECGSGTPSNSYEVRIINRPTVTAVDPGSPDASLTAYPNPATADVRVNWRAASRSPVVLRILSVTGSVIWQVERTATGAEQTELIPAGLWAAGVYTLQLQTGNANAMESRLLKL